MLLVPEIILGTDNFFQAASESPAVDPRPLEQVFACTSCDLTAASSAYFQAATPEMIEKLPGNLMTEWKEFFSEGIHGLLLPLLVKITSKSVANVQTLGRCDMEMKLT